MHPSNSDQDMVPHTIIPENTEMEQAMSMSPVPNPLHAVAQDDRRRPRLERVDQQPLDRETHKPRRFDIAIQSVYYYLSGDGVRCAVLLTTSFDLKDREKLACAVVPLTARPKKRVAGDAQDNRVTEEQIEITAYIPHKAEHVLIGQQSELRSIYMAPNIGVSAPGAGVNFSGLGVTRQRTEQQKFTISLLPKLSTLDGEPDCVQWKFQDANPKGIFYPSSTNIIVIVERTDGRHVNCFTFELRLEWKLRVDVHSQSEPFKFSRYLGRADPYGSAQHDGWCFHIKANYKPSIAETALAAALDGNGNISKIPPDVGLDAAIPLSIKPTSRDDGVEEQNP